MADTIFRVERPEHRKEIPGYDGRYEVSDLGRVYTRGGYSLSLERGMYVRLCRRGVSERVRVSYLVARAFLPNPYSRPYVWHRDGDRLNCRVENLEWSEGRQGCGGRKAVVSEVLQYDRDGSLVGRYGSVREAAGVSGVAESLIRRCAGGSLRMTHGYIFRFR